MKNFDESILQLYDKNNLSFTYYTATGKITIVAGQEGVTEEWIQKLKELHRIERNSDRREQKNTSIDAIFDLVGDKSIKLSGQSPSIETWLIQREEMRALKGKLRNALSQLTENQLNLLIRVRIKKISISSIARDEGVHESSVRERLRRIENKLKKLL